MAPNNKPNDPAIPDRISMNIEDAPNYGDITDAQMADITNLTDEVAIAALTGVLANASSLEAQSAAVAVVWFKIIPEWWQARDAYFATVFQGEDAGSATQADGD